MRGVPHLKELFTKYHDRGFELVAVSAETEDKMTATLDQPITLEGGGWLAFRADGPGTVDTLKPTLNAHTNPVYIESGGVIFRSAEEARAFLKWIDQFEILLLQRNRFPTADLRKQALAQLESARLVYSKIAKDDKKN